MGAQNGQASYQAITITSFAILTSTLVLTKTFIIFSGNIHPLKHQEKLLQYLFTNISIKFGETLLGRVWCD